MPQPQTLLSIGGAERTPSALAKSTVLIIDAQKEYIASGRVPLDGIDDAMKRIAALLDAARTQGRPIVHVAHRGKPGGLFDPETSAFAFADPAAPRKGEAVVFKTLPDSFVGSELDATLKKTGATNLIVAGFMTHMCVSSTVRTSIGLGYAPTVIANACATRDLPDGHGGRVAARDLHRNELVALSDLFAAVVDDMSGLPA
jgi:nicotinamidase-related amidase